MYRKKKEPPRGLDREEDEERAGEDDMLSIIGGGKGKGKKGAYCVVAAQPANHDCFFACPAGTTN